MKKTIYHISKMDCASEEQMIRMKLEEFKIEKFEFDLANRKLTLFHNADDKNITSALEELKLNSAFVSSEEATLTATTNEHGAEKKMLWTVLIINFSLFLIEIATGFIANSMGLVADSLDMLADAIVYGLSLYAVGHIAAKKKQVAKLSGYFQMALAIFGLAEVIRRFLGFDEVPGFQTMIVISILALVGNAVSLYILQKSKSKEAHMQASVIFTSNDVIVNLGVIVAGIAVYFTKSKYPDLIVGSIVFLLVANGALRILKLSK